MLTREACKGDSIAFYSRFYIKNDLTVNQGVVGSSPT